MNETFEHMADFFQSMASKEGVASAMLRVLGSIDVEKRPELKNDRDMLITFMQTLL